MRIDIDLIYVGRRLRDANAEQVAALAASIAEVGLLSPITVYKRLVTGPRHIAVNGFGLIAGLNRLEAVKSLGHTEIEAHVVEMDDLDQQIAECDENLCGTKLTPAERSMFTRRRKDAYEGKHPETRHGGDRKSSGQVGHLIGVESFTADTAKKTGQSERVVRRDVTRGENIGPEIMAAVVGTTLDKGVVLDALAATPVAEQAAKLEELKTPAPKAEVWAAATQKAIQGPAPVPAIDHTEPSEEAAEPQRSSASYVTAKADRISAEDDQARYKFGCQRRENLYDYGGHFWEWEVLIPSDMPTVDPAYIEAAAEAMAVMHLEPRVFVYFKEDEVGSDDEDDDEEAEPQMRLVGGLMDLLAFRRISPGGTLPITFVRNLWDADLMALAEKRRCPDLTEKQHAALAREWPKLMKAKQVAEDAAERAHKAEKKRVAAEKKVQRAAEQDAQRLQTDAEWALSLDTTVAN